MICGEDSASIAVIGLFKWIMVLHVTGYDVGGHPDMPRPITYTERRTKEA
jgi:hypothetical protein